mgnify:CR=1 FL=1
MGFRPLTYYGRDDLRAIRSSETFEQLLEIAFVILGRMPEIGVGMVCGPITTGGLGNLHDNLALFTRAIVHLDARGEHVFTQLPFETAMQRIKANKDYCNKKNQLLETFFRPIFNSGRIKMLYFMPRWNTSVGTMWEHDLAKKMYIARRYLRPDFATVPADQSIFL